MQAADQINSGNDQRKLIGFTAHSRENWRPRVGDIFRAHRLVHVL